MFARCALRRLVAPSALRRFTQYRPPQQAELRLQVLAAALKHVPQHGWSSEALALGAVDAGLPAVAHGIFSRGPIELVEYFMEESAYEVARVVEARRAELVDGKSEEERMVAVILLRVIK